jgi:hypothetical protein
VLTLFGACALFMMLMYALERRHRLFVLGDREDGIPASPLAEIEAWAAGYQCRQT